MTYEAGLDHDPENKELMDGVYRAIHEMKKDPEASRADLDKLMKDPEMAAKVHKLMDATRVPP